MGGGGSYDVGKSEIWCPGFPRPGFPREKVPDTFPTLLAVLLNEPTRRALVNATEGYSLVGAPSLPWEIGNALVAGVRRKQISAADVQQAWASYQSVPVRLAHIDAGRAVNLSLEVGLYAYDGYVLETALAEGLALLTLDLGLARAAQKIGVKLQEF